MRKLIISMDTYYWIRFISGMVFQDSSDYELIIIYRDIRPVFWMRNLCFDAIYEQRKFDLFNIGKKLGIKKVSNLRYEYNNIDFKKFSTEFYLYTILGNIGEIYYQDNIILDRIAIGIKEKYNGRIFSFGNLNEKNKENKENEETKRVILDEHIYRKKIELRKLMIGINNKKELDVYKPIERFCEI